jgi:cytochrome c oxidase assembly factor CtaG
MSPTAFSFEPLFLALVALAALAYARAARSYRPGKGRAAVFALGLFLIAAPLDSPLETIAANYLLVAHLAQNAIVADWAPPLLVLGLTPEMRRALAARGGRAFALATTPALALPLWLGAWYGVHLPPFYEWALRTGWGLSVEHAILIGVGLLFWWPPFEPQPRRLTAPLALAYLGAGFVASPWLALAYIFFPRPLYGFYADAPRIWDLSPRTDQALGGMLMQTEMALVFLALIIHLFLKLASEEEVVAGAA